MGTVLGTNDWAQRAECNHKGCKWWGYGNRARRLFPPPASPAQSLVSKVGQEKAGCATTAWAESKCWAQVLFPKFPNPWQGALHAPEPHSPKGSLCPAPSAYLGSSASTWHLQGPPAGAGGCWVLIHFELWKAIIPAVILSSNSCCNLEEFQGHNIHFPLSVAGLGNSSPGAYACLLLEMIELS